jgi:hypothetical protein
MYKLEGFKVVETGMVAGRGGIGGKEPSTFFATKEEAKVEKVKWQNEGRECGIIEWKE